METFSVMTGKFSSLCDGDISGDDWKVQFSVRWRSPEMIGRLSFLSDGDISWDDWKVQFSVWWRYLLGCVETPRTTARHFDNFVVNGGTVSCHDDNLRCHQSQQSCQKDYLLFSVRLSQTKYVSNMFLSWRSQIEIVVKLLDNSRCSKANE